MNKKILVIEDERATRINLLGFLESEGFEVIGAENGRLGVKAAKERLPHLIICDVLMPELDGYDVLSQLQEDPLTAKIPFIFLTVETNQKRFRQSMEMGADDYLSKPVTSERLRRAIESRLRRQEVIAQPPPVAANDDSGKPDSGSLKDSVNQTGVTEELAANIQELQEFISIKNQFFDELFRALIESGTKLNLKLATLKATAPSEEVAQQVADLEKEFAKILALTNQGAELQRTMTPKNAKLLQEFNFFDLGKS
jgi:DNA-binding response OmpR family regulator